LVLIRTRLFFEGLPETAAAEIAQWFSGNEIMG